MFIVFGAEYSIVSNILIFFVFLMLVIVLQLINLKKKEKSFLGFCVTMMKRNATFHQTFLGGGHTTQFCELWPHFRPK